MIFRFLERIFLNLAIFKRFPQENGIRFRGFASKFQNLMQNGHLKLAGQKLGCRFENEIIGIFFVADVILRGQHITLGWPKKD